MSDLRRKHELLRDECNRRAEAAWRTYLRSDLSEIERIHALDQYHGLRVAAEMHANTIISAADVRPVKFTRRNKGAQSKTASKLEFVQGIAAQCNGAKRQALALAIWDHPDAGQHFKTYEAVYRFLGRPEFF